jgi:NAD(P)-dependent dehydrogenase (short-subunit alcohol dehydrogenase family)
VFMSNVRVLRTDTFSGQNVIVTGAGSGIGRATALEFAAYGAHVVCADLHVEALQETLSLIEEVGGRGVAVVADVSTQIGVDEIVKAATGRADVLANVAGIMDGFLPVAEVDDATWERVLAVNLTGPMRLTRAVLPLMLAAKKGAIINVASEASLRGSSAGSAYTTSKHALIGLTQSTAFFYGRSGIRTNAVCPGGVRTNIDATPRSQFGYDTCATTFGLATRFAESEELSSLICWLASDAAVNINGAIIAADGGWSVA